jgi:hypothetical protein
MDTSNPTSAQGMTGKDLGRCLRERHCVGDSDFKGESTPAIDGPEDVIMALPDARGRQGHPALSSPE